MSRSDGKFPKYSKLNLDPEQFPKNYWDSSLECSECGKRWPKHGEFSVSVCCQKGTKFIDGSAPDMRWPEAVYSLNEYRFEKLYEKWNENVSDEQLEIEELKTNGKVDPEKVSDSVDKLINESTKPKVRPYQGVGH